MESKDKEHLGSKKLMQLLESNLKFLNEFKNFQKKELEVKTFTSIYLHLHDDVICKVQGGVTTKGI